MTQRLYDSRPLSHPRHDTTSLRLPTPFSPANHLHALVRIRPDLSCQLSDEEVGRRWLRIFRKRRDAAEAPKEPNARRVGHAAGRSRGSGHTARAVGRSVLVYCHSDWMNTWPCWIGPDARFAATSARAIPLDLRPIFVRLSINAEGWVESILDFGRRFHRVIGRAANIAALRRRTAGIGIKARLPAGWRLPDARTNRIDLRRLAFPAPSSSALSAGGIPICVSTNLLDVRHLARLC